MERATVRDGGWRTADAGGRLHRLLRPVHRAGGRRRRGQRPGGRRGLCGPDRREPCEGAGHPAPLQSTGGSRQPRRSDRPGPRFRARAVMPESSGQRALRSRALGAFYGLAIGDALGMPTESRSRQDIVARYGDLLGAFEPGPPDHPLAAGLPAGTVTDDTEQTVLLARLIVEYDGEIGPAELASRLLVWEDSMRARGSLSLLGPSTQRALGAIIAGASIEDGGRFGTTNGAASRITPVGVATPSRDRDLLGDRVVAASRVTHNTGIALAGAAAGAAAVTPRIDGATPPDGMRVAAAPAARAAPPRPRAPA